MMIPAPRTISVSVNNPVMAVKTSVSMPSKAVEVMSGVQVPIIFLLGLFVDPVSGWW